ncbi:hypothetical protein G5714_011129 [Onychostoma macrolepis]|uniref:Uncharacterized protein n=1 Tax=Onychostoma macrolepis TaxID=369639 RepID=A0A7J6CMB9_9TELE|nr:hypothetical protein G5714_011129 [Onychostoma macrolepis]
MLRGGSYPAGLSDPRARSAGARVPLTVKRSRRASTGPVLQISAHRASPHYFSTVSTRRASPVAEVLLVLWNQCWS